MDEAIGRAVKAELGLLIGRNAARSLKMTLGLGEGHHRRGRRGRRGAAHPAGGARARPAGGRALEPAGRGDRGRGAGLLSDIPPNLAEDVVRGKIRLAGGGALLPGLA